MHEASLISDLVHRIERLATEEGAKRVTRVSVWVGALSHMSAEHFREHFSHAAAGTIAEAADLSVQVSTELDDPNAQSLLLQSVEIDM